VGGMTCAACVRRVEKGLSKVEGVAEASVNFATETATVLYDPDLLDRQQIASAIEDIGYTVVGKKEETEKTTVMVGGMTCAACVRRVERSLKKIEGVLDAQVNLATSRATVIHEGGSVTLSEIGDVIHSAGYEFLGQFGKDETDPVEEARRKELKDLTIRVIAGIVLSILTFMGSMQHWFPFLSFIPRPAMLVLLFFLTTPVVFWVGSRFIGGAIKALRHEYVGGTGIVIRLYIFCHRSDMAQVFCSCRDDSPCLLRRRSHDRHAGSPGKAFGGACKGKDITGNKKPRQIATDHRPCIEERRGTRCSH